MNTKALAADVAAYVAELKRESVVSASHYTLARLYNKYGRPVVNSELERQVLAHEAEIVDSREPQDSEGTST